MRKQPLSITQRAGFVGLFLVYAAVMAVRSSIETSRCSANDCVCAQVRFCLCQMSFQSVLTCLLCLSQAQNVAKSLAVQLIVAPYLCLFEKQITSVRNASKHNF